MFTRLFGDARSREQAMDAGQLPLRTIIIIQLNTLGT